MSNVFFTVFTPVYNRKHTIHRVWDSLNQQTYKHFEWIIVNDGSEDGIEPILESYENKANFPIRIFHQKNSGKHIAFNRAIDEAVGELLVPADSDDSFIPATLEVFNKYWTQYKSNTVSGISVLCVNEDDTVAGDKFPIEGLSNYFDMIYKYNVGGEKWGCTRVDILRKYKFPEINGAKFFPESYIWAQIGLIYQTVYLNIPLRKYYQDAGNQIIKDNNLSPETLEIRSYYYVWFINSILPRAGKVMSFKEYLKQFVSLWRYSLLSNKTLFTVLDKIKKPKQKILAIITYAPSYLLFKILKLKPF